MTEVQKNWHRSKIASENVLKSKSHKDVDDLWKKYSNYDIDYDDFEDALLGFESEGKITKEERKRYQDKAEKFEDGNNKEIEDKLGKPKVSCKDKVKNKLKSKRK